MLNVRVGVRDYVQTFKGLAGRSTSEMRNEVGLVAGVGLRF